MCGPISYTTSIEVRVYFLEPQAYTSKEKSQVPFVAIVASYQPLGGKRVLTTQVPYLTPMFFLMSYHIEGVRKRDMLLQGASSS